MSSTYRIPVKPAIQREINNMKGEESYNNIISALLLFYKIMTAEQKEVFSYLMKEGTQSAFLAGFLYKKMCEIDVEFLILTINLAENSRLLLLNRSP